MNERWKAWLLQGPLLVLAVFLLVRIWNTLPMFPNWDLLGYMGVAQEWVHDDPAEVHRSTYELARQELPAQVFATLVDPRQPVRHARHQDPEAFGQHLAFYRARVLPTLLMKAVHAAGAPLSFSLWWIHKASLLLTALLVGLWLARWVPGWAAIVAATLLAHAPPLLSTAVMSTSDGLATLLLILAAWGLVERRSVRLAAIASVLALLTRPDTIILLGLWIPVHAWLERGRERRAAPRALAIWLAVSLVTYFTVQGHAGEYGWWPLIHISFLEKEVFPSAIDTAVRWDAYGALIAQKAAEIPGVGYFQQGNHVRGTSYPLVFAAFALVAAVLARRARAAERFAPEVALLVAMLLAFTLRWFLFPQLWDRFFTPLYVLVPLLCVSMVGRALSDAAREGASDQNASKSSTPATTSS